MNNHHVNMYGVMHMFVLLCVMLSGWAIRQKSYIYCLSFYEINSFSYNIFTAPNMSAGQALMWSIDMWVYLASWSFSHILSWQCFHLFVYYYCPPLCHLNFWCVFLPLSLWMVFCLLFIMYVLVVIIIVVGDLVWVWLWIVLIWSRMASSGSVCLFVCFLLGNICNPLLLSLSAWYVVCYM